MWHQFLRPEGLSTLTTVLRCAVMISAALMLITCARGRPESPGDGPAPTATEGTDVTLTLDVQPPPLIPVGSEVTFQITLRAEEAITLQFATSQRYEFVVERNGTRIWGASDGKAFLQVLGSESLQPGEERRYSDRWTSEEAGDYVVTGSIASSDRLDLSIEREFSIK